MSNFFSNFFSKSVNNNASNPEYTESVTAQVTELDTDTLAGGEITVKVTVNFNSTPITVKRGTSLREIVRQGLKLLGLTVREEELTVLDTKTNQANSFAQVADNTVEEDSEYSLQQSSGTAGSLAK